MPEDDLRPVEEVAYEEAIRIAGGPVALGRELGITSQAISRRKTAPAKRVPDIERITGVSRHRLCPELFGPEPSANHQQAREAS